MPFSPMTLVWIGNAAWGLSEIAIIARDFRSPAGVERDAGSRRLVMLAIMGGIFAALFVQPIRWAWLPMPRGLAIEIGVALMLAGIAFRLWAVRTLGAHFTTKVTLLDGHRLIDSGPYARLRNPSYTGSLVTCLGFGLTLNNGLSLLVMLALPGLAFGHRIAIEEGALAERFGSAWHRYRAQRWALVPPVW